MLLAIKDLRCNPNIISPEGEAVTLSFKALSGEPTHLRARYWFADEARFLFRSGSSTSKETFVPSRTQRFDAPTTWKTVGEKSVSIVPEGGAGVHNEPLKLNLEVFGFDGSTQLGTQDLDIFLTIDTLRESTLGGEASALSMALRIVNQDVGVSHARIAEILSWGVAGKPASADPGGRQPVSADLVGKVARGGSSSALLEALRGK